MDLELADVKKEVKKQEKRVIALKERMKKNGAGPVARRGPDDDEIFEDEGNEYRYGVNLVYLNAT